MEPYPKSLAPELFKDIVAVDKTESGGEAIDFSSFVGVGPRLYGEVFGQRQRKEGTRLATRPQPGALPRFGLYEPGSLLNETLEAERLRQNLIDKGLTTAEELKRLSPT